MRLFVVLAGFLTGLVITVAANANMTTSAADHTEDQAFYPWIEIRADVNECMRSAWMTVEIRVDGQRFRARPSCNFQERKSFRTSRGSNCVFEAGMCSGFWPFQEIEVRCDNGFPERLRINCPRR